MMDFREQWPPVDMKLFREMIRLHNDIAAKKKNEDAFDVFVLQNKEKLNNPDYLSIFVERVELDDDYFNEHEEVCRFFYDFMKENPDWKQLSFGLRTFIHLGSFESLFEEFLITSDKKSETQ